MEWDSRKFRWMQTPEYRLLRHQRFTLQGHACQDCGQHVPLELHHVTYQFGTYRPDKYGTAWGTETLGDVVGLCRNCHLQRHLDLNDDFWADPDEKESYWDSLR